MGVTAASPCRPASRAYAARSASWRWPLRMRRVVLPTRRRPSRTSSPACAASAARQSARRDRFNSGGGQLLPSLPGQTTQGDESHGAHRSLMVAPLTASSPCGDACSPLSEVYRLDLGMVLIVSAGGGGPGGPGGASGLM